MQKLYRYCLSIIQGAVWFSVLLLAGQILVVSGHLTIDQYIKILETLAWPSVVVTGLLLFREVASHILFSVRKFGLFDLDGRLRAPEEVMEEYHQNRLSDEKLLNEKRDLEKDLEDNRKQIEESKAVGEEKYRQLKDAYNKMEESFREVLVERNKLRKDVIGHIINERQFDEYKRAHDREQQRIGQMNAIRHGVQNRTQRVRRYDENGDLIR